MHLVRPSVCLSVTVYFAVFPLLLSAPVMGLHRTRLVSAILCDSFCFFDDRLKEVFIHTYLIFLVRIFVLVIAADIAL